jgi:hypoxanthine phosphoribosyltransferase
MRASSYGHRGTLSGDVKITGLEDLPLSGKNVLLVDDVYDSGKTMFQIIDRLRQKNPKTLKSLVLVSKNVPRDIDYAPDYVLFDVENLFLIGYGLDYKERYRGLPDVYALCDSKIGTSAGQSPDF